MEKKNKLDEVSLGNVSEDDLMKIQKLEQELGEKYYLIAFERK